MRISIYLLCARELANVKKGALMYRLLSLILRLDVEGSIR